MDDFAIMQTEMQASINSQTSMMYDLFDHFKINPRFKLGGDAGCPGMSPRLSHFVPRFSSYLITCLVGCTTAVVMIDSLNYFQ
jgi:hypothetical protein